jgi:hypothetical protein
VRTICPIQNQPGTVFRLPIAVPSPRRRPPADATQADGGVLFLLPVTGGIDGGIASERGGGLEAVGRVDRAVLVGAFLVGVVLRIWVLRSPLRVLDSDEAVVGLMARRVAYHGETRAFFWGQGYGGTLEPTLTAFAFRVVGPTVLAVKLVPLLLSTTATALLAVLGARLVGWRRALYAAAAFWIWNGNYIWWSTKSRCFYWAALNLGLVIFLMALRVGDEPRDRRAWFVLGAAVGLGWWTSPQLLLFLVPAALWSLWTLRRRVLSPASVWAVPPAILGALPWLVANYHSRLGSLRYGQEVQGSYPERLRLFFTKGAPVMFGLHATEIWLVDWVFPILYIALVLLVVWALRRHHGHLRIVWLFIAAYPLVFAVFPTSWAIGEGRYLLYLLGPVALALAALPTRRWLLPVALPLILLVTLIDLHRIELRSNPIAVDKLVPIEDGDLRAMLEREHIRYAWADYWIAYRVTFETRERILVSPDLGAKVRDRRIADRVQASGQAARIIVGGSTVDVTVAAVYPPFANCVRRWDVGPYVVYAHDEANRDMRLSDGRTCAEAAAQFLQV